MDQDERKPRHRSGRGTSGRPDDAVAANSNWKQRNIDECVNSLRKRIRQLHPFNADVIISYMISRKTPMEIRQYLNASDDQIQRMVIEATSTNLPRTQQFPLLSPPQPPYYGGIYTPFIHWQPRFYPSGSYHGMQPPLHPINHVGPLQHHQFHPSGSSHGIQVQNPSTGPARAFQSPFPGFIGMGEHFQPYSVQGDGLPTNYGNALPGSSKEQIKPFFFFSMGSCKKGESCSFSHGPNSLKINSIRQVKTLESLPMLEKEISELLRSLRPPRVPIESLANMYTKKYGKPLKIEGFSIEGQQFDSSFTCLLTMLCTTRVIERHGQCYIVPVEEAPKYLDDDFNLVMPTAGSGGNQICITFGPKSTFTREDVLKYFSQYGPVNDVLISLGKNHTFGYVSFLYHATVKDILSERSSMKPHFICGNPVFVKALQEKHELDSLKYKKLAHKDAHSNSIACKASGVNAIHEHYTVDNEAGSSHVQGHLDEAPVDQDSDYFGLPESLDDIY